MSSMNIDYEDEQHLIEHNSILMADQYIFMVDDPVWFDRSLTDIERAEALFPWEKKIEKAYFRGATSSIHEENFENWGLSTSPLIK